MSTWKNETFTEIMRTQGMRQAFEYRRDTLGDPIPYEHLTDEEKLALETPAVEPQGDVVVATTIPAETPQNESSVTAESEPQGDTDTIETPTQVEHHEEIQSLESTQVAVETPSNPEESSSEGVKQEYTVDEVKAKLTEAGIKFHHMAGAAKIMELAVANNLI